MGRFEVYQQSRLPESGDVNYYNPELSRGNKQIASFAPDSLVFNSRRIRVGLGTTVADSYEIGNTFTQFNTNASGGLVGTAGSITSDLNITRPGIGYTQ